MPDSFFETGEHRLLVAGVHVDDPVRGETDLGQRRREQILPGDAPQDLAFGSSGDAGGEQGRRRAVDGGIATSRHFVQRPERQTATGKAAVDVIEAKRKYRSRTQGRALKALNLFAESPDRG